MKRLILALLTVLFLTNFSVNATYKIKHLEPAFWWVGMKNPNLQLMIHGENISDLKPEVNHPGVSIRAVSSIENPNYLFVDLRIDKNAQAGKFDILLKKDKKTAVKYTYELKQRKANSANRPSFTAADVMYLITPDRFANGNPDNDTVKGLSEGLDRENKSGRHGGDIQGIVDHLDYLADMGFTAIWINPLVENNMKNAYHGYAATDFYKIDARFGSNEEYRNLSVKAQQKGLGIIMDVVLNHCGSNHWWMKDMPSKDWINFDGKFVGCSHKRTTVQDKYASKEDRKHFTDGWFVKTMPDLNQRNPFLATYLIQNVIWWIESADLYGLRVDTYPYSDAKFLQDWTSRILEEYPNFNIVGEEWSTNPAIISHWQRGKKNENGYVSYLPSLMDFPMQNALKEALTQDESWGTGWIKLYELLATDFLYPDPNNLVIFPDNHDMSRIYNQLNKDFGSFKIAMAFFLTTRGIPQIFYGTEILANDNGNGDHGLLRSDFPGGWAGDKANAFTGKGLSKQEKEAQEYLKKLLNWRKNSEVIHKGKLMHYAPEFGIYSYFRYTDKGKVMVILNKNTEDFQLDTQRYHEMLDKVKSAKNVMTGELVDVQKSITVPARSAMILEIN